MVVTYGGDGNDTIIARNAYSDYAPNELEIFGGSGNDSLQVSGNFERVSGGSGNDTIELRTVVTRADATLSDSSAWDNNLWVEGGTGYDVLIFMEQQGGPIAEVSHPINIFNRLRNIEKVVFATYEFGPSLDVILDEEIDPDDVVFEIIGKSIALGSPNSLFEERALGFVNASAVTQYKLIIRMDDVALTANEGFSGAFAIGGSLGDFISSVRAAKIYGALGDDTVVGSEFNDILIGGAGNDKLDGDDGADIAVYSGTLADYHIEEVTYNQYRVTDLRGGPNDGVDTISGVNKLQFSDQTIDVVIQGLNIIGDNSSEDFGGSGSADFMDALGGADTVAGGNGNDWVEGGTGNDMVYGNNDSDVLLGEAGNDRVYGGSGNDTVNGSSGNDVLSGSLGTDMLLGGSGRDLYYGGAGEDDFIFKSASETAASLTTSDVIIDFAKGIDDINLAAIDALSKLTANNTFLFRGTGAITHSAAGEISFKIFDNVGTSNDYALVYLDTDADQTAEAIIKLTGKITLTAGDFIL